MYKIPRFAHYYTNYIYKGKDEDKFKNYINSACFSDLLHDKIEDIEIYIAIAKGSELAEIPRNHSVLIPFDAVGRFIKSLNLLGQNLTVELLENIENGVAIQIESSFKSKDYFVIKIITDKEIRHYELKLMLTLIRMLYESPFSIHLGVSYYLKEFVDFFKNIDIVKILTLVMTTIRYSDTVHSPYMGNCNLMSNLAFARRYNYAIKRLANACSFFPAEDDLIKREESVIVNKLNYYKLKLDSSNLSMLEDLMNGNISRNQEKFIELMIDNYEKINNFK